MLSDLDTALKASTNYIESHKTTQLPNGGHQEYHEYRSTTTSGTPRNAGDDFNLEKQVGFNFFYHAVEKLIFALNANLKGHLKTSRTDYSR